MKVIIEPAIPFIPSIKIKHLNTLFVGIKDLMNQVLMNEVIIYVMPIKAKSEKGLRNAK